MAKTQRVAIERAWLMSRVRKGLLGSVWDPDEAKPPQPGAERSQFWKPSRPGPAPGSLTYRSR